MTVSRIPFLIILGTQLLFTLGDLIARSTMRRHGFTWAAFLNAGFLVYFLIRQVAMVGQLYVFASVQLGRSMALFGAASIVLSSVLGLLVLGEHLSTTHYVGIMVAVTAFLILALGR